MKLAPNNERQLGFTLIELLVALGIFLIVTGAAFTLLGSSQQRYQTESQVLTSFQEARLGLDQIVRDVNDSGYPPPTFVSTNFNLFATTPFAWSTGYPTPGNPTGTPCSIGTGGGGTCNTPGDFDLIIETNPNPQDSGSTVQWIRYQLQGTTLFRGIAAKQYGDDPALDTSATGILAPFVQNVVNNASPAQIAQYQLSYPSMFPGGVAVPIFSYTCDTGGVPLSCPLAGTANAPANIRDVVVTLIVAAPLPDATTGQPRVVMLSGRARRINPNQ
jgi:prepilin-type N-terminal cleavage/methylation domain-containing protein